MLGAQEEVHRRIIAVTNIYAIIDLESTFIFSKERLKIPQQFTTQKYGNIFITQNASVPADN